MPLVGDYLISETVLGEGSNSVVLYGQRRSDLLPVAFKLADVSHDIEREIVILKRLGRAFPQSHSFPRLLDIMRLPDSKIALVFEYLSGNTLLSILSSVGRYGLSEEHVALIIGKVAAALQQCRSIGIAHCDIKLENIMITDAGHVVLIDFGLAHLVNPFDATALTTTKSGSMHYVAPELITLPTHDSFMSDVWSLGVTFYALLCNRLPFFVPQATDTSYADRHQRMQTKKRQADLLFATIVAGKYTVPPTVSPAAADLLCAMLCCEPSRRATLCDVLRHPFVCAHSEQ